MLATGEERWVTELLAGLDTFAAYYTHMGRVNAGPDGPDLRPACRADADELPRRIVAGE